MNACSFPGCRLPHHARGYCSAHYRQLRRDQEVPVGERPRGGPLTGPWTGDLAELVANWKSPEELRRAITEKGER